ncbi:hypothetical protein [Methanofollis formosanus]|nr:hypothetical protein [Methanofollis formosanus]
MKKPPFNHVIIVFLLIAALLIMPAAARTVAEGDLIFDYETDLDLTAIAADGDRLVQYTDDDPGKVQVYVIPIPQAASLDLTAIDLQGHYGTYYLVSGGAATGKRVYVREPTVTLDVVLEYDHSSSIDGMKVSPRTPIAFKFVAPQVALSSLDATVKVEITKPNGAKTFVIGDRYLTNHALNRSLTYIGAIDLFGLEEGTYTAQATWQSPHSFANYAADSNTVNFTVGTFPFGIESNKERLVRGNSFAVTLAGEPKAAYFLYVRDAAIPPDGYPLIKPGQPGVTLMATEFTGAPDPAASQIANRERAYGYGPYAPDTAAVVTTTSAGTRTLEFSTTAATDDRTFTIKVVDPSDATRSDEVTVTVEQGEVTITAGGAGTSYPGEEIALSGTNTDSDTVYLFMTGPNLDKNGVPLDNLSASAANGAYLTVDVQADDTWEYCWDTGMYPDALPPGIYTLYAASSFVDGSGRYVCAGDLGDVKYDSAVVRVQGPSVSVQASATRIAAGDEVSIEGTATGSPETVALWAFGDGGAVETYTLPVQGDDTFLHTFERDMTALMYPGQHYLIVQHPMTDGTYAVRPDPTVPQGGSVRVVNATGAVLDLSGMTASDAAFTVLEAIREPACDDICAGAAFTVQIPEIVIDEIGEVDIGENVTITGTTTLAAGDHLALTVRSASVNLSSVLEVADVNGEHRWSHVISTVGLAPGGYEVQVSGVEVETSASGSFVVRGAPTPTLSFTPATGTAFLSSTTEYAVVLNTAPEGLSGYNLTVSLDDPAVAEIVGVSFPTWNALSSTGALPADTLWITGVDLNDEVAAGAADVTLCTLTIRGTATGTTGITLVPTKVDTDFGGRYAPETVKGTLDVVTVVPFQRGDGSAYPPPTDPDGDGVFEDLDGNGWTGFNDVVLYFNGMDFIEHNQPIDAFDYDGSGFIGFNDVVGLFERI